MYNLLLPNLCATCSSLATLRLPTVDPYSAEVPGEMCSHTVLCGDLYMAARFFRNPSSLTRYGQDEWYPRRDPTTRLAALGRGADTQS